jgi:hypothetical protein
LRGLIGSEKLFAVCVSDSSTESKVGNCLRATIQVSLYDLERRNTNNAREVVAFRESGLHLELFEVNLCTSLNSLVSTERVYSVVLVSQFILLRTCCTQQQSKAEILQRHNGWYYDVTR